MSGGEMVPSARLAAFRATLARPSVRNAALVYFGYSFRFISPLLLYPLLTRRLGAEAFGLYAAAYSLALMLSVIVEYGFNLSGTREVAVLTDARRRGEIAARITGARLLLVPAAAAAGAGLAAVNPAFHGHSGLVGLAIVLGSAQGSTAFWYFQGIGRVLKAVGLEIGCQVAALVAMFIVVRSPDDLILALFLQATAFLVCSAVGGGLMFRDAPARLPKMAEVLDTLRAGFAIFLSRAALVVYTSASVFLLAGLVGPVQVALYGSADRVVGATTALLRPLSSIMLPRLAVKLARDRTDGMRYAIGMSAIIAGLFLSIAVALWLSAPIVVRALFGAQFAPASPVLQWLAASLPFVALNTVLGSQVMVALRLDRQIMATVILGGAINLLLAFPFVSVGAAQGMAVARLATEIFIAAAYVLMLRAAARRSFE